ncbi:Methyl-accepting chemotaxis protein 4 [Pontiella sulfatireligans]|uniref:Methyl-accepting chemotaxis protein 4 n=1 Tax=Pontiella sulfatireligans TaxID=2750658 RepID=A0A6C2UN81_9BACT|nr:Methyl-accepting chemotaxis protein 4 [Pontiella sulfatireligans]
MGIRAEDIHKWIDGFFDAESFDHFVRTGSRSSFNPYNHRKYRHSAEALEDAYREFEGQYSREEIKAVFESHIRDDYDGFIPLQEDFESGTFEEKYHESESDELEQILSKAELSEYFKGRSYPNDKNDPRKLSARFYWHIVWPTVIAAILFAASTFTVIVPVFRNSMMNQKKAMIKELTATAASAIRFYIHQEQSGAMTKAEAQRQAASEVSELRYGLEEKDYFWITDMHPRMVMHPYRPELVEQDLTDYTDREDKSGKKLFVELVDLVKAGDEGYLEYLWQWMDDASRAEPKLSYVRGVPEWGWVIGTGVYIHDVEEEIARLSRNLLIADGAIAMVLLALLVNIVYQSRRIELDRKRAETGLREAKDRYRALVEGANEGYVLEVDGETVYSNHTLRRMIGYSETELASMKVWELLEPDCEVNAFANAHLKQVYAHTASSAEFEARILSRQGAPLDVLVSTSRIFFSEKNGHVISIGEIRRGSQQTLEAFYRLDVGHASPSFGVHQELAEAKTAGQVIQTLKQLPELVRRLTDQGVRPVLLRETIGKAYDASIERFISLSLEESGTAPVPFAFLSLGSNARHEMTLFSDQDNALIFADVAADQLTEVRRRFLALSDGVCAKLNQAGYPFCPGGIMAANPKWCLSVSEWKKNFGRWILQSTPESLLEVNVFFDIHLSYGDEKLGQELRDHVRACTDQNPEFFIHYAKNCLGYKAPLGLLGRIRTEKRGSEKTINVKQCIKPIETFARIYALQHHVDAPGTLDRLEQLHESGALRDDTFREMVYVFDYLWRLRFYNQISATAGLRADADELDITSLTDAERDNLQSVLSRIPIFQTKLSYDFLGMQV